jgi:hypothetical protein
MLKTNVAMTASYMDDGIHTNGQSMPPKKTPSLRSRNISRAMETIDELSKGGNLDNVVTTILSNSVPQLRMYVNGQRETPETKLESLAMQAAVLRLADAAVVARNNDINDLDATLLIEGVENDLLQRGHFNSKYILPYETQAAINVVIDSIVQKHKNAGGTGKFADIIDQMKVSQSQASYFMAEATPKTVNGVIYYNDHPEMEIMPEPVLQTQQTNSGVLDFIDKAIDVVKTATGEVQTLGNTAGDVIDDLKNKAGNLGGDIATISLRQAIIKNLPLILGTFAATAIIILIIVYAAKPKN